MKVIIAGGTGFLGGHVGSALRDAGHEMVLLARGSRELAPATGVTVLPCDVASGLPPLEQLPELLKGSGAIVNLIGIKREQGEQTFERVHVNATAHLIRLAKALSIRLVHVSVVASRPDPKSKYHDTKWRAEELVKQSALDFTILRPGVIYGPGDDMTTHLVKMIRFAPLFPVVGKGQSVLQPVHARDVARAILAALERPVAIGKSYDIVGPARMTEREVVRTVAQGMSLRLWMVNTPIWFHRMAVRAMNVLMRSPLATPAQLQMLIDGLYGDPEPARKDLSLEPIPFTQESVRALAAPIPPLFGFSLRFWL